MFDQRSCASLVSAAIANGVTIPDVVLNMHVNDKAVNVLELWGGTSRPALAYNQRVVLALEDISGVTVGGQVNDQVIQSLNDIKVRTGLRSVTVDLAGSGGDLANSAVVLVTVKNENLDTLRSTAAVTSGVGSSTFLFLVFGTDSMFSDYDGEKDVFSITMTTTGSITWGDNGVGPRIVRFNSTYAQSNDVQCFRNTTGTDRLLGVSITGQSAGIFINSGTYDARSISCVASRGATMGGWTDTVPTQGEQLTASQVQSARAANYITTQDDASLLDLSDNDPFVIGFQSILGAKTCTMSQSTDGVTFTMGSTAMTVRYIHLFLEKGT